MVKNENTTKKTGKQAGPATGDGQADHRLRFAGRMVRRPTDGTRRSRLDLTGAENQCKDTGVRRKKVLSILLSIVVSAALLGLLFSAVPRGDLLRTLGSLFLPGLAAFALLSLSATAFKAGRIRWLLRPWRLRWKDAFIVTFIRNAFEDLLPARLGSLSYIVVLTRNAGVPFEAAASTFAVMLAFDFLTLPPFVITSVLFAGKAHASLRGPLLPTLAAVYSVAILVLVWKIVPAARFLTRLFGAFLRVLGWEKTERAGRSMEKLERTVASIAVLRERNIVIPLFLLSFVIRLFKYLSLSALLFAVLHPSGFGLADLSPWKIILALTAAEFTSALPVKGLADFGTWESAWVLAFALMGLDRATAVLSGFSVHLVTNLFEYALAAAAMLALALRSRRA